MLLFYTSSNLFYTGWAKIRYTLIIFLLVGNYLDNIFPLHWNGRRGSIDWPPRSPDLTPMDFFFWGGVVKNKLYERKLQTVDELKEFITEAFMDINSDRKLCGTVCQSVSDRLDARCNVD